jgi:hypothetical protein
MIHDAEPFHRNLLSSCLGGLATGLVLIVGGLFLGAWLFMLAVGVAHDEWAPSLPTIGYWASVKVCAFGSPLVLAPMFLRMEVLGIGCLSFTLAVILGAAVQLLLVSWLFMLFVGVAQDEWLPGLPAVGYWTSVKLCAFGLPLMLALLLRPPTRVAVQPERTSPDEFDHY